MKVQFVLGLFAGAGLAFAASVADAEDAQPVSAKAVQMQLDEKTGQKLSAADDSNTTAVAVAAQALVDARGRMPMTTEEPQHHSDGSISIKLGTEQLKYLVMTIDEDGEKSLSHQTDDELNLDAPKADKGEK